ncbi:MAG: UDP-galactopyranose mutase [Bacteroidaceae bacterium]|nr:UDP-galactopyranose mutase [Bacteroidaceae bacterium]
MDVNYDYLIVGSGLFGATFAYRANKRGKKCLVIDKRSHLGGNVYCENIEGINVHKYGAHIFHTSNKEVWDFVNSFVEFNRYTNSPIAINDGRVYNLPFNMNTFSQMWGVRTPEEAQMKIEEQKSEVVKSMREQGVAEPRNLEEQALMLVGRDIYEKLIRNYTEKQWGRKCTDLPPFIIKRLPVRFTYDNNFFNDSYQGIPVGGYNCLVNAMLDGIECRTGIDYFEEIGKPGCSRYELLGERFDKIVFSGRIDEFYEYRFGELEYRTVRFEEEIVDKPNFQGNAVVNYPDSAVPYTRVIEHKHFEMFGQQIYDTPKSVVSREFSTEYKPGMEPYYPVNDEKNNALYAKYKELADREDRVVFGGRLAEYKYYDMAPIIEKVLKMNI